MNPLPIGTLVEDPSALTAPRPPLMKRMCCGLLPVPADALEGTRPERCDLVLGWVVCARALAGEISHGMCPACRGRAQTQLADYLANQPFSEATPSHSRPRGVSSAPIQAKNKSRETLAGHIGDTGERTAGAPIYRLP